jgi:hypothetical protein
MSEENRVEEEKMESAAAVGGQPNALDSNGNGGIAAWPVGVSKAIDMMADDHLVLQVINSANALASHKELCVVLMDQRLEEIKKKRALGASSGPSS